MKKRIDHPASFKDPAATVFTDQDEQGYIFRALSSTYLPHYSHFITSGLAAVLRQKNYIIPFEQTEDSGTVVLKTAVIDFVSYPYEWSFDQWKDAVLLTLKIQYQALKYGMVLKDATPFNILFHDGKPVFVDLSSFEIYQEGKPWIAFKQFCENLYMPLLLAKYFDETANEIYLNNSNGINIQKGLSLLPARAFFNLNVLLYLVMPGAIRKSVRNRSSKKEEKKISLQSNINMANHLFSAIEKIRQHSKKTKWNEYYERDVDAAYIKEKETVLRDWLQGKFSNSRLIDFGCNAGNFSILSSPYVKDIVAFDADSRAVNNLYHYCRHNKINNIFCFCGNLANPAPATGWNNGEHLSLMERLKGDIGIALARQHQWAISSYIQFDRMAALFSNCCNDLLIEFIPKEDDKVKLLLANREDIFDWYNLDGFIDAFSQQFQFIKKHDFFNNRVLFHFRK